MYTSIVRCTRVMKDIYCVVFFSKEKTTYSNNSDMTSLPIFVIVLKILKFKNE